MSEEFWNNSAKWYDRCVGEKGHYYHQTIVLPNVLRLLGLKKGDSLLDLGCGQGVLFRRLSKDIDYLGIDHSQDLIERAKRFSPDHFLCCDASKPLPIEKRDFDAACFILSLQNIELCEKAIANAARHLRKGGRLLLVLNHPCFRIPRQSHWGVDEKSKIQYRRMNGYMSSQKIPIQMQPSRSEKSPITYSHHHSLSKYTQWLANQGLVITAIEEWCSNKKSEGSRAKMEDRARCEFPLFLALLAKKT